MLFSLIFLSCAQSAPAFKSPGPIIPREYLTIAPVDLRGRRPFQPDVIYRDHIWKIDAPAPLAGQPVTGELAEEQAWVAAEADAEGRLSGSLGYAYTSIEMAQHEVRLAKLSGAWTLYVNGRAYFGDAYNFGFGGVPVVLNKGTNQVYVTGIRGGFSLQFVAASPGLLRGGWDETLPHLVLGESTQGALGIELSNLLEVPSGPIRFEWEGPGIPSCARQFEAGLSALGANQFALPLDCQEVTQESSVPLTVSVSFPRSRLDQPKLGPGFSFTLKLDVRRPAQTRIRTYISAVDHSAQQYAIVPPEASEPGERPPWMGLALSLHGAGVSSFGQANCYRQRPDFWIVAPMNRRPYGFDWQDWGRRDAYDVLALALEESGVDARFKYVTGHSMGGHGTWHLAANDLDGFAACAPSAGWESFDSYGGRPPGELAEVWHAADASSRTLDLIGNLSQLPTFILHGTADHNVPATQALSMLEALTRAGGTFESHFEGGAGHWWGNRCLDWPPFFDFFRKQSIALDPKTIDFRTVAPAVDAQHHWVRVEQPLEYGKLLRIHGSWKPEEKSVVLSTENVALFAVERDIEVAELDGQRIELDPERERHWFRRVAGAWDYQEQGPSPGEKQAARSGPLKNAFDRDFLLIVGTHGTAQENAAMLASAQLHAGSWRYRANGCAPIMTDEDFALDQGHVDSVLNSNLILYGNRDINSAFAELGEACPIDVRRGRIELRTPGAPLVFEGDDLGCAFVYPDARSDEHLVGVFAFSGLDGARLSSNLQPFKSGVGYPDFTLYNSQILTLGDGGVLQTGWFDAHWQLPASVK